MRKLLIVALVFLAPTIAFVALADDGKPADKPAVTGDVPKAEPTPEPTNQAKTPQEKPASKSDPVRNYETGIINPYENIYQDVIEKAHKAYREERRMAWDRFKDRTFAARSLRDKVIEAECNKCCDAVKNAWHDLRDSVENAKVRDARKVACEKWHSLKNAVCQSKNSASVAIDAALANYEEEMNAAKKALKESLKYSQTKLDASENSAYEAYEKNKNQKVETVETPKTATEVKTQESKPESK